MKSLSYKVDVTDLFGGILCGDDGIYPVVLLERSRSEEGVFLLIFYQLEGML
jgi:hypothetical protein